MTNKNNKAFIESKTVEAVDKVAAARALIVAEEQKAQQAFINEINAVCEKHGFNLQTKAEIVVVNK